MARRRACRLLCQSLDGPNWAETWAIQIWRYWSHTWRKTLDLPNVRLVRQTSQFALDADIVRPGTVEHIIPRKFQKAFRALPTSAGIESWEIAASDRLLWKNLEAARRAKWVQGLNPAVASDYLMHMQLLVVGTSLCILRPVRDLISEMPYKSALLRIQEATRLSAQSCVLLRFEPDQGTTVVILKGSLDSKRILLLQQPPKHSTLLDNKAAGLRLAWHPMYELMIDSPLQLPQQILSAPLLLGHGTSPVVSELLTKLGRYDVLERASLHPKKFPPRYKFFWEVPYSPYPARTLLRNLAATWARYT